MSHISVNELVDDTDILTLVGSPFQQEYIDIELGHNEKSSWNQYPD